MSLFSDCFNRIKDKKDYTCAEIASKCKRDTIEVFSWMKGKGLPEDESVVEEICRVLGLSKKDEKELYHAYKESVQQDEYMVYRQRMADIQETLRKKKQACNGEKIEKVYNIDMDAVSFPEVYIMHNRMEILQCLQDAYTYIAGKKEKNICMQMQRLHKDIEILLKMCCSEMEQCNIQQIVCTKNDSYRSQAHVLEVANLLLQMTGRESELKVWQINTSFYANWLITDDFVIEYADDFSSGMFCSNPEWVRYYKKRFEEVKERCVSCLTNSSLKLTM